MRKKLFHITSSIYIKILGGFGLILFLSFAFGYGIFSQLNTLHTSVNETSRFVESLETLSRVSASLELIDARIMSGKENEGELATLRSEILLSMKSLEEEFGSGEYANVVSVLVQSIQKVLEEISILLNQPSRARDLSVFSASMRASLEASEDLDRLLQKKTGELLIEEKEIIPAAKQRMLVSTIIVLCVGIFFALFLSRTITSPVEILRESVDRVSKGDYGAKVAIHGKDEIGSLADAFNEMSGALENYTKSLEGKVNERTKELNEKVEALNILTKDLDESAQMLIRRDLALTRATERLEELDVVKSEFMSVVAHQLRTPLSAIKWTLDLLMEGGAKNLTAEQKEYIRKAVVSNERMIRLIEDMLTITRIESGKTTFVTAPVLAGDVLKNVLTEIDKNLNQKDITLTLRPIPEHHAILADAEKLHYVFQNIIENAIRYTPSGGSISVELVQAKDGVTIAIHDDGIGIPESQKKNIFSKFFRADNAMKKVTEGTGLGLYVAKTIVDRHHGRIWFESREGKGTTFFVFLPNEDAPFGTGQE